MSAIRFRKLDVRELLAQGIEPFPHIRAAVDAVAPGEGVSVIAPFLPSPLIEKLRSEGFQTRAERRRDGAWSVDFWRD